MKYNNKKIRMLPINPRYTEINKVNFSNLSFEKFDENECIKKLLRYEGDLSDLKELIESILENGFKYVNDQIILKSGKNDDFLYVLEGNRRFMSIIFINDVSNFISINFEDVLPIYSNKKEWTNNKNEIIKLIKQKNIDLKFEKEWFFIADSISDNEIWQIIYSKHAGEQKGKRNWSRAKYFKDIFDFFLYKKITEKKEYDVCILELSKTFSKKQTIIKSDVQSSIWVIRSINLYNSLKPSKKVDYNNMEVSGFELLLSRFLETDNGAKTLRVILGFSVDDKETIDFSFNEKYEKDKNEIISFFIEKSLDKSITTREIKEEIIDELSLILNRTLGRKSLYLRYKTLKNQQKNGTLKPNSFDYGYYIFLHSMKNDFDIDKNKYLDLKIDSKFIKSIKYIIRNEIQTLSDFRKYDESEYPFSNVAWAIRSIFEMFQLEIIYRTDSLKYSSKKSGIIIEQKQIKDMSIIITKYADKDSGYNTKDVLNSFKKIIINENNNISLIADSIKETIEKNSNLDFGQASPTDFQNLFLKISYHISKSNIQKSNFSILNNLVHKPYYGFENKNEKWLIDGLNESINLLKELLGLMKIRN